MPASSRSLKLWPQIMNRLKMICLETPPKFLPTGPSIPFACAVYAKPQLCCRKIGPRLCISSLGALGIWPTTHVVCTT